MASTTNPMNVREFLDEGGVNELSTRIFEKVNDRLNTALESTKSLADLAIRYLTLEALVDMAQEHIKDTNNPHQVTLEQLGLENVENKSSEEILAELQIVSEEMNGLMTPAMLKRLNAIPEDAMKLAIDNILSKTSEQPVQNKVIVEALDKKAELNPEFTEAATLEGIHTQDHMSIILGQMAKAISTLQDAVTRLATAENNVTNLQNELSTTNSKIDTEVSTAIDTINKTIEETKKELNDAVDNIAQYDVIQQDQSESGFFSTYQMTKDGVPIGAKINIPKDYLVKSVSVKVATDDNQPFPGVNSGDKYVDWVINTADDDGNEDHLYIAVKDLMNPLSAANGGIFITDDNGIGLKVQEENGLHLDEEKGISMALVDEDNNGAMTSEMLEKLNQTVPCTRMINGIPLDHDITLDELEGDIATLDEDGKVEAAKKADQADNATNAEHADIASQADNATNAENADQAGKLAQEVEIGVSGVVEGSVNFDGSSNVTINITDIKVPVVSEDPTEPAQGQIWIRS